MRRAGNQGGVERIVIGVSVVAKHARRGDDQRRVFLCRETVAVRDRRTVAGEKGRGWPLSTLGRIRPGKNAFGLMRAIGLATSKADQLDRASTEVEPVINVTECGARGGVNNGFVKYPAFVGE